MSAAHLAFSACQPPASASTFSRCFRSACFFALASRRARYSRFCVRFSFASTCAEGCNASINLFLSQICVFDRATVGTGMLLLLDQKTMKLCLAQRGGHSSRRLLLGYRYSPRLLKH